MASFSDGRCEADGVCPNDPLLFTCEVNETSVLRLTLPGQSPVAYVAGSTPDTVSLPAGITVKSLDTPDNAPGNFTLTLSIENASLLAGSEIRCDDGTDSNAAMAACPLLGMYIQVYLHCMIMYIAIWMALMASGVSLHAFST